MGRGKAQILTLLAVSLLVGILSYCDRNTTGPQAEAGPSTTSNYLNLHDTVGYVGIETCRQCHAEIYQTYIRTGMGSSFGVADTQKSIADIDGTQVLHDPHLQLSYYPHWQDDSLRLTEFRLAENGDTLYQQTRSIDYVVGSGQHTNSHILEQHGYLTQAPFTWYSQEARLDLPPGFEGGHNTRFDRLIGLECTSCHNAMPTGFIKGSINKYAQVPHAIDCERCHGPGELHVQRVSSGQLVDTATATDYSIVNVAKLPVDLQFEVCQRCHLQGNTVLQPGKSFLDFKPGMRLNEVMEVYLPRYANAENEFIMASHVDRFRQSRCVVEQPQGFNCISCHNPHLSVKETKLTNYNQTCAGCHGEAPAHQCTAEEARLIAAEYNCVGCHMPASGSTDIPHVSVHDHRIQVPGEVVDTTGIRRFLGLAAVNNPTPTPLSKARAYLQQFERFEAEPYYLDSAYYFLQKGDHGQEEIKLWVYYYFLSRKPRELLRLLDQRGAKEVLQHLRVKSYDNEDAWAAYRIGESYQQVGRVNAAGPFYERSVQLAPFVVDFRLKLANHHRSQGKLALATEAYQAILQEQPRHREALNNLGFILLQQAEPGKAEGYFRRALQEDPDYELAWLNLANSLILQEQKEAALSALSEALRINPANQRARQAYTQLKQQL